MIEVKGRIEGAHTVTVTNNEILTALNKSEDLILALVQESKSEEFSEGDVWKVKPKSGTYNVGDNGCVVLQEGSYVDSNFSTNFPGIPIIKNEGVWGSYNTPTIIFDLVGDTWTPPYEN